jgi:hypothetical protein
VTHYTKIWFQFFASEEILDLVVASDIVPLSDRLPDAGEASLEDEQKDDSLIGNELIPWEKPMDRKL